MVNITIAPNNIIMSHVGFRLTYLELTLTNSKVSLAVEQCLAKRVGFVVLFRRLLHLCSKVDAHYYKHCVTGRA